MLDLFSSTIFVKFFKYMYLDPDPDKKKTILGSTPRENCVKIKVCCDKEICFRWLLSRDKLEEVRQLFFTFRTSILI